jgi:hypothetical protein
MPPVDVSTFSLRLAVTEVGIAGIAGALELPHCELDGVPGDMSPVSSRCETDMFRLFRLLKLEDEKFFFNLLTEGEAERPPAWSSTSGAGRWPKGEPRGRVSAGPISASEGVG